LADLAPSGPTLAPPGVRSRTQENGVLRRSPRRAGSLPSTKPARTCRPLAGLPSVEVALEPVIVPCGPVLRAAVPACPPYLLTVARIDGIMKGYVRGLVEAFAELVRAHLGLAAQGRRRRPGPTGDRGNSLPGWASPARSISSGRWRPRALPEFYAGATAFIGMGTAAVRGGDGGAPTVVALAYDVTCRSPGYFGEPGLQGFGEDVPGQPNRAVLEAAAAVAGGGRAGPPRRRARAKAHAFAEHHPDAATERLRALLTRPAVAPTPHPWPLPKWRRLLGSLSRGFLACSVGRWPARAELFKAI
jgi:hypothetical protein